MKNLTDEEVKIINGVCQALARDKRFQFAFYEQDDIEQEAFLIAWEVMDKYDGRIPLKNFLYIHLKNRLKNFKRDNYIRYRICNKCDNKDPNCLACMKWNNKITSKLNLLQTTDSDTNIPIHLEDDNDIIDVINTNLPIEHRKNFRKLLDGSYINKDTKVKLVQAIIEILHDVWESA